MKTLALAAFWFLPSLAASADQPVIDRTRFLPAPLTVRAEDLEVRLVEGAGFVTAGDSPSGLVLVGRGVVSFAPPVASEQREVELFCGARILDPLSLPAVPLGKFWRAALTLAPDARPRGGTQLEARDRTRPRTRGGIS